jgi:hypothetical protein
MKTELIYKDGKKYSILESSGNLSKSQLSSDESDWPEWRKKGYRPPQARRGLGDWVLGIRTL